VVVPDTRLTCRFRWGILALVITATLLILASLAIGFPVNYRPIPCPDPEAPNGLCRASQAAVSLMPKVNYWTNVVVPYSIAEVGEGLLVFVAFLLLPLWLQPLRFEKRVRVPAILRGAAIVAGLGAALYFCFYVYSDMVSFSAPIPLAVRDLIGRLGGELGNLGLPSLPDPLTDPSFGLHGLEAFLLASSMFFLGGLNGGVLRSFRLAVTWVSSPLICLLTGVVIAFDRADMWIHVANTASWAEVGARTFQVNSLVIGHVYGFPLLSNMSLFVVSVLVIILGTVTLRAPRAPPIRYETSNSIRTTPGDPLVIPPPMRRDSADPCHRTSLQYESNAYIT